MPTLINELTPQQRSWIFETFGHYGENDDLSNGEASSDDLESQYIHQNNNSKNNEVSTPVRRNSNDSINYCNDPSPTPYVSIQHPFTNSSAGVPHLSASDQTSPTDTHDNRSSIFRRSIGGSTSTNETNNASPVREEGEEISRPITSSSTRNRNERTAKPHPGSIWSPLNDKIIISTPPTTDHHIYGNNNTSTGQYDHSPNISNMNLPNSFNMFPRPPFARSINHNLEPAATAATTMALQVRTTTTTTMSMASSAKRHHHTINDDPNFHLHHPHPPHLHHPHHHMYPMRPIPHHHHFSHSSVPLGQSKVPSTADLGHHHRPNNMHTPHHGDIINIHKPIVFPHSDDKLTWQQSFENLKIYKRIYGDCNVPQKYKMNVKLGGWVVCMNYCIETDVCFSTSQSIRLLFELSF